MTTEKLRECPFCGGCGELKASTDQQAVTVQCLDCGAQGPVITVDNVLTMPKPDAVSAWNDREPAN